MSFRLYLSMYGINRTLSLGTDDDEVSATGQDPEKKLAERLKPLQTTLREAVTNRKMATVLKGVADHYNATPLSAASKCLWMIGQGRDGSCSDNKSLLYDKWAVKGLERLVGHETFKVVRSKAPGREKAKSTVAASEAVTESTNKRKKKTPVPYDHRAAEYEKFCEAWLQQYSLLRGKICDASNIAGESDYAQRLTRYWGLPPDKIKAWCNTEWFRRRVFDAMLHVIGGRWSTASGIKRDLEEFDLKTP
jgi:hypothetical protein